MDQYLDLLSDVLEHGTEKKDRTGTGTISTFGSQTRYDLRKGFPLVTTKKVHLKSIVHELLWFLSGDTNIQYLNDNNVKIWDDWRKPYSLKRGIIQVVSIQKEYQVYNGNFSYKGIKAPAGSIDNKLANAWRKMMERCYKKDSHNYSQYGAKGVSVCKRWHECINYIGDVKKLPHWFYKENDWNSFELDKDYYSSNQYSPNTCVWLHTSENNYYTKAATPIKVTDTDGRCSLYITLSEARRQLGMTSGSICRFVNNGLPEILKGGNKRFKGWVFEGLDPNLRFRYELIEEGDLGPIYGHQWRSWDVRDGTTIDQISEVIEQIKTNPDSRRLIVSAWNVGDLDEMALPPCHLLFQFYVNNGELSCQLYQRSADLFLGVPFNIASYALLTHMIAHVCGLKVGEFIHSIGDTHIYSNHIEQVKLQLSREPLELPILKPFSKDITSIFDFKYEDVELLGYMSHAGIKGKVAV